MIYYDMLCVVRAAVKRNLEGYCILLYRHSVSLDLDLTKLPLILRASEDIIPVHFVSSISSNSGPLHGRRQTTTPRLLAGGAGY